jgi:hypothetical protein
MQIQPQGPVAVGTEVRVSVTLDNDDSGASSLRGTVTVAEGLTIRDVQIYYPHHGTCSVTGNMATCDFDEVAPRDSRAFVVYVRMPVAVGTYEVTAASGTRSVTQTIETENRVHILVTAQPHASRVDPGTLIPFFVTFWDHPATLPGTRFFLQFDAAGNPIETIEAPGWECSIDGSRARCAITASSTSCCPDRLVVTVKAERPGTITVDSSSDVPGTFERAVSELEVYRHIAVTTTADAGPGSLRAAFEEVNAHCDATPCKVDFAIAEPVPAEGWFTIVPETPLPVIDTQYAIVDGRTQTALTGDTNPRGPEVAIDGRNIGLGLEIHARCEAVVAGLALGNFQLNEGLWLAQDPPYCRRWLYDAPGQFFVADNHIGVDPTGTTAWPNLRGLRLDDATFVKVTRNVIADNLRSGIWMWRGWATITHNRIERNGASGIFFGPEVLYGEVLNNTIAGHPHMGVAVAHGAKEVDIRNNSMRANGGLAIDWGLDGPSPVLETGAFGPSNAPLLLSAVHDAAADQTVVTMTLRSRPLWAFSSAFVINLYANDGPDGDGETPIDEATFWQNLPGETFELRVKGDLTGKWINATSTRVHWLNSLRGPRTNAYLTGDSWTSEFSNTVQVTR